MSAESVTELRPQTPPCTDVPGAIASGVHELSRQFAQAYALVSSAKHALGDDNKHTAHELLEIAEDELGDLKYLHRIGAYLGVDAARIYPFGEQEGAR